MGVVRKELVNLSVYLSRVLLGVKSIVVHESFICIEIDKKYLVLNSKLLKSSAELKFTSLMDIWGLDFPEKKERFQINYLFLSLKLGVRLILRTSVKEFEGVSSLSSVFNSSGWLEREVWDMYGVVFFENNDLRRILTDYGFDGHPLRKDFPLSGFMEVRYDDLEKRVVYEPLETSQEYRIFNFKSPWEKL